MCLDAFSYGLTLLVAPVELLDCPVDLEYWLDMLVGLVGKLIKDCVAKEGPFYECILCATP